MARSALADSIRDAILELQSDLTGESSITFTWKSAEIQCIPNHQLRGSIVIQGGHEHIVGFSLNVLREHFVTADSTIITVDSTVYTADNQTPTPVAGKFLTFRGKEYRILTASLDPTGVFIKLDLGDKQSGR